MKQFDAAPEDPRSFVYIIFYWLGIGTLLPWNFFISVSEYWKFKWRDVENATNATVSYSLNEMQTNWSPHMAVASMVPNVSMLLLNAVFGHRFKTQPRLLVSLSIVIVLFIFTVVMTKTNTDEWQETFYIITLVSVVLINVNAAIFQGGLLGLAGKFPPRYMGGVFSGQALGGIFASATNVICLALGANAVNAAFFSFIIAVVFLATALVGYVLVTKSKFFKFFVGEYSTVPEDCKLVEKKIGEDVTVQVKKANPLQVLLHISLYAVSIFLIFLVTLGCFPAITVLIVSTESGSGDDWPDKYFIPVICFLLFNVGDFLGRTVAEFTKWPKPNRFGMILTFILSLLRLAFVPLFVACNANPNNRNLTPVVFANDYVYILLMILFSLSNGYLGSVCMMSAPQVCEAETQQMAANIMVAFLGLGLGVGAAVSNLFLMLL